LIGGGIMCRGSGVWGCGGKRCMGVSEWAYYVSEYGGIGVRLNADTPLLPYPITPTPPYDKTSVLLHNINTCCYKYER